MDKNTTKLKKIVNIRVLFAKNPPDAFSDCARFPTLNPTIECNFPGWCVEIKPTYVVHSRPKEIASGIWNAFKPYSKSTWILMLVMFLIQTIYCLFVSNVEFNMNRRKEYRPLQIIWKFIRLQLYQPDSFDFATKAGNFSILVFTIMQCRLLLDMYQTLLLSALLQPTPKDPFTDARDMIKMIASQKVTRLERYALPLIENCYTVRIAPSVAKALDQVAEGGYIFPIQQDSLAMQMAQRRCNLVYIKEGLPEISSHIVFRNNSKFIRHLDQAIVLNMDFIRRTYNKYFENGFKIQQKMPNCNLEVFQTKQEVGHVIKLEPLGIFFNEEVLMIIGIFSMFGVFICAAVGLGLALFAFALEIYYAWHMRMFQLRLKTRRAMAEPVHLMALARVFAGPEIQQALNLQISKPTLPELQAYYGELYM